MDQNKYNEYITEYVNVLTVEKEDNWLRGEIAECIYQMDRNERAETGSSAIVSDFLRDTSETKSAFASYRWVFNAFPDLKTRALPGLTWTHFRAAAGTKNPDEWIKKAHDNKWSTTRLITEVKQAKAEEKINAGLECSQCSCTVDKMFAVEISYLKKRRILCSPSCAIAYLTSVTESENDALPELVDEEESLV